MMQRNPGVDQLAQQNPSLFGMCVALGVQQERARCTAHLKAAATFGRPELAIPGIVSGEPCDLGHWERYMMEAARRNCIEAARAAGIQ